jgi:hypothetical protein
MVMSKKGELQAIFVDYLLVTSHTREALMTQIYDNTVVTKLRLSPEEIRQQCTGAAFDGQYFSLKCPEHLARRMVEQTKGGQATRQEIQDSAKWMLCTWDPAHKLELVVNDIRVDNLDLDVGLMSVPLYAQIPKDISAMYACCRYGKQCEELLKTTEHLGKKWYAMVRFCETRLAQSELKVYINFEKIYHTYCRAWVGLEPDDMHEDEEP